ncbi:mitochondrial RNA-splicing protein Mrs4p [Trichomonascus vanleenenianus]|uniref:Fe(2+) transporter n=1 Tax=Trichomonascus vanleenenianus TaxID=2268995 RepID=UPI003ECB194D
MSNSISLSEKPDLFKMTPPKNEAVVTSNAVEEEDDYEYEALPENTSLTANLMAGAFAGIMEHSVMFPVDAIKTRMQAQSSISYSGIANAMSKISATEGARTLWRGVTSVIVGAGPAHAVYFAVYEYVKKSLGGSDERHHPFVASLAGAAATTSSDALMNPFDVIKQRMQVAGSPYRSVLQCARTIYAKEGLSAFYVSYPTTLIMNVPFTAVNFTVYESASRVLNPNRKHDPISHIISGGLAGGCAAAITTPLDVVKTLLQTKGHTGLQSSTALTAVNSFMSGARYIYATYGMAGFMRGLTPRIVANMPSTAICWTSYEMAKFYIHKQQERSTPRL